MPVLSFLSRNSPKQLGMVSLRQVSFGKEEETRTLKPFAETLRVRIPPGKAGPAARSESCVVVGRPILRSVDSEVKGRVIEPRKYNPLGAFVLDTSRRGARRPAPKARQEAMKRYVQQGQHPRGKASGAPTQVCPPHNDSAFMLSIAKPH